MLVDALAEQDGQLVVPVFEQRVKGRAVTAPGAGHHKHSKRGLQLVAGARQQCVHVVTGDAEYCSDLTTGQALTELQFEDFPFGGSQPVECVAYQGA